MPTYATRTYSKRKPIRTTRFRTNKKKTMLVTKKRKSYSKTAKTNNSLIYANHVFSAIPYEYNYDNIAILPGGVSTLVFYPQNVGVPTKTTAPAAGDFYPSGLNQYSTIFNRVRCHYSKINFNINTTAQFLVKAALIALPLSDATGATNSNNIVATLTALSFSQFASIPGAKQCIITAENGGNNQKFLSKQAKVRSLFNVSNIRDDPGWSATLPSTALPGSHLGGYAPPTGEWYFLLYLYNPDATNTAMITAQVKITSLVEFYERNPINQLLWT